MNNIMNEKDEVHPWALWIPKEEKEPLDETTKLKVHSTMIIKTDRIKEELELKRQLKEVWDE